MTTDQIIQKMLADAKAIEKPDQRAKELLDSCGRLEIDDQRTILERADGEIEKIDDPSLRLRYRSMLLRLLSRVERVESRKEKDRG